MANSYSSLMYHFVFSTKGRIPWLKPEIEQRVWEFMGGVARAHDWKSLRIGGFDDHIHALISAGPMTTPVEIVKSLKAETSHWIHNEFPYLAQFAWQDGYACFSVGVANLESVRKYIERQRDHHQVISFEEEYQEFLRRAGIAIDERYVFG